MKPNSNTILIVLVTLIVAAGAYWYFFTGTSNQPPLTIGSSENKTQVQFQTLVGELRPISFNTSIFSDPRFNALIDLSTPISPEPMGRPDPFAPIAGVSGTGSIGG